MKKNMEAVISFNGKTGKITLTPVQEKEFQKLAGDILERINTFDDVLEWHGFSKKTFYSTCQGLEDDEIAYRELKLITRCLNELGPGERLDRNATWYTPYFERRSCFGFEITYYDFWDTYTDVGSRLSYKSDKLALGAGKKFPEIYKRFMLEE
jgi:hypothetical protein